MYALGFVTDKGILVKAPLIKQIYEYEKIAVAIHYGPYETVANSFNNLLASIESQGLEVNGPPLHLNLRLVYELYVFANKDDFY